MPSGYSVNVLPHVGGVSYEIEEVGQSVVMRISAWLLGVACDLLASVLADWSFLGSAVQDHARPLHTGHQ